MIKMDSLTKFDQVTLTMGDKCVSGSSLEFEEMSCIYRICFLNLTFW